jgi:S-methylmethionine-dependent homocysteine/selenocysteine methylase
MYELASLAVGRGGRRRALYVRGFRAAMWQGPGMPSHAPPALADGGIETTLTFHQGLRLPWFAAFPLVSERGGREAIARYFDGFLELARLRGLPFVLDTVTWRANPDWGTRLGYDTAALAAANREAVSLARALAARGDRVTVNGVVGPRGEGYAVSERMSADEAADYHAAQIATLSSAGAERITALTLTYAEEATGIVQAAAACSVPVVISFTVETDGRLPDGTPIAAAIDQVDAATSAAAEFFMLNCAHPTHIAAGLTDAPSLHRIGGLRPNASALSHAELDASDDLDAGDPPLLARDTAALRARLPSIRLLGGCCGTDLRHITEIVSAWQNGR